MGVYLSVPTKGLLSQVFRGTDLRGSNLHTLKQCVKESLRQGATRIPKARYDVQGHISQSVLTAEGSADP